MRRLAAFAVLLAVLGSGPARAATVKPRPLRVMSMNLCADQLVLALLPPERIASVSWLARDRSLSLMAKAAAGVPVNRGTAEEVVRQRPDLVLTGSFPRPAVAELLARVGVPVLAVDHASDYATIRRITRQVAVAVGATRRGEALIARMDAQLAAAAHRPVRRRVAVWGGDGIGGGTGSLLGAMIASVGATDVGSAATHRGVEGLLRADPDLLLVSEARRPDRRADVRQHPVVRARWGKRTVRFPAVWHGCGTPMVGAGVAALSVALRAAPR